MTPNGAVVFTLMVVVGAMLSGRIAGLMVLLALCVAFGVATVRDRMIKAVAWSAGIVAPLAVFMAIVWIAVVGRSPAEIAAGVSGTRVAALGYVATICARLFVVALAIQLVAASFAHQTPLQFIRALRAPLLMKKLLVLTLAWVDTILQAVDRSRTALVTAGIISPGVSLRNAANGWILVQTVWLSVITIAVGRLRDKWPTENTLGRLDACLSAPVQSLTPADWWWLSAAVAGIVTAMVV